MEENIIELFLKKIEFGIKEKEYPFVKEIVFKEFKNLRYIESDNEDPKTNDESVSLFINSKKVEGCSGKTVKYYTLILDKFFKFLEKKYKEITTEDIRQFLTNYKEINHISNVSINNMRRIISSYFSWLENEDYIIKSPVRRIHKVKVQKVVKKTFTDEEIELMRNSTNCIRDRAIIDLLSSTGIRVGELVEIKIKDVNFKGQECVVTGKGNKQRMVYFDAKSKLDLISYLNSREDNNEYLFVSRLHPHSKLNISGVEIMLRKLGKELNISKVYPHKFRRSLATKAIDKGMPIEQVQHLLGHTKIDTTLEYAMVDDENVKRSHKKYLC